MGLDSHISLRAFKLVGSLWEAEMEKEKEKEIRGRVYFLGMAFLM
jgi:hypothetical protein